MIRADERVMEAFASPHGQVIAEFLSACQLEKSAECIDADVERDIHRAQGASRELKEIVGLANNARSILHSR